MKDRSLYDEICFMWNKKNILKNTQKQLIIIYNINIIISRTKRNETKRNETKRNETKRNNMSGLVVADVAALGTGAFLGALSRYQVGKIANDCIAKDPKRFGKKIINI